MSQDPNMYNAPYPPQQPGGYGGYPPQQPGAYGGYPPQQPGGYGQSQMPFQPPPVLPRPDFPKDDDDEQGGNEWGNFNGLESKEIRRVFIRKVYSILMIQLLITFGLIAIFHFTPSIREYIKTGNGQWLYFTSYAVFLVTYLALACSKRAARRFPLNMVLLLLLTLAMGYMMGMISAYYKIESVLIAVGITAFVCLGVTLFSFQTKYDFTSCGGILLVISLALFGFGIIAIFTYSRILYTIYAGLGAVAFSIFLAVDTQLIMGGKRHEISAEDHVFASIMLYLDIVYIFIFILQLLGQRE
jgi:FtsH-binding integral membrane protein